MAHNYKETEYRLECANCDELHTISIEAQVINPDFVLDDDRIELNDYELTFSVSHTSRSEEKMKELKQ